MNKSKNLVSKVKSSERKTELEGSLDDLNNREGAINSQEVISKNKINEMKGKIIQELFKILENFGVDPSDLNSINKFLSELEKTQPDLLKLFELTFNDLIKEPENNANTIPATPPTTGLPEAMPNTSTAPTQPIGNEGLMDKYKNLGQETMMPR